MESEPLGSCFVQESGSVTSPTADDNFEELNAILSAAGTQLPVILPSDLKFDKPLGKGTSFEVAREIYTPPDGLRSPYYVAVKHVISAPQDQLDHRKWRNESVARELQTLVKLGRANSNVILLILGYGWDDSSSGRRPYIVADYSDHGTLPEYLKRISSTMAERRELALDVAVGLKFLHDIHIAHGDLKPSNILVFDAGVPGRSQVAKLADFGASMMKNDERPNTCYTGTPLYNAPEQSVRGLFGSLEWNEQEHFYMADVWSLGLTVWEIMQGGHAYFQTTWLEKGQTAREFLDAMASSKKDGILSRALEYCKSLEQDGKEGVVLDAMEETFGVTLKDDPEQRSPISKVVETLAQGTTASRPKPAFPPTRTHPPPDSRPNVGYRSPLSHIRKIKNATSQETPQTLLRHGDSKKKTWPIAVTAVEPTSQGLPNQQAAVAEVMMMLKTPWETQCKAFKEWEAKASSSNSSSNNFFRLALCYHVGFGTQPDSKLMMEFLTKSAERENEVAKALYYRVACSQGIDIDEFLTTPLDMRLKKSENSQKYFAERVFQYQKKSRMQNSISPSIGATDADISAALCRACQMGNYSEAMDRCSQCKTFIPDPSQPTAIHWLIMFNEKEAELLGQALIHGSSDRQRGPCRDYLNCFPITRSSTILMPEHCLELSGSPLHWAVQTGNIWLVRLLAKFGADLNVRWGHSTAGTEVSAPNNGYSPLDVAVSLHLPEMIEQLLDLGAEFKSDDSYHSAFHCIGKSCTPLSRQVIHGAQYRHSLKETISLLTTRGFDINIVTRDGINPLLIALTDPDCEPYIIEELLDAKADAGAIDASQNSNAAIIATQGCITRRYKVSCLHLIASRVLDINMIDISGRCALHYAAVAGSGEAVRVLSTVAGFDVNRTSAEGYHSMYFAVLYDAEAVISALLELGVDIDISIRSTTSTENWPETALMMAARLRKKAAANFLLERGAQPDFRFLKNPWMTTVLHAACDSLRSGDSILSYLVAKHQDVLTTLVNVTHGRERTVLQTAVYYGDVEAVEALLKIGADKETVDSSGRTALQVVTDSLSRLRAVKIQSQGIPHQQSVQNGPQEATKFKAALERIQQLLA
ncbi:hypothetical protein ACSS6W_004050 [Trichoderma asperelloides]